MMNHEQIASDKRTATLKAKAALAGFELEERGEERGYLLARWDRQVHLTDVEAVESFLERWRAGLPPIRSTTP